MANFATQYYNPNEEFQISSIQQLTIYDQSTYTWSGRILTSWTDESGNIVALDSKLKKSTFTASLSGNWKLNQLKTTFNVISNDTDPNCEGGYLSVQFDTLDDFKPLPERTTGEFTLHHGETNNDRYYGACLSVYAIANDGWIFNKMRVFKLHSDNFYRWTDWITNNMVDIGKSDHGDNGLLSVEAEFVKGVLTYYANANSINPNHPSL